MPSALRFGIVLFIMFLPVWLTNLNLSLKTGLLRSRQRSFSGIDFTRGERS
jgi:hypothetical protein